MNLSVAIATYNEEENIGKCLESVAKWCDEIVLVDGTSKDKTVEIAKKFGARISVVPNQEIFHINKQLAIDKCQGKWILQLDADEVVTPELKEEILKAVSSPKNGTDKINGYWIPRKNYFLGKFLQKGGQYPDFTLRLYKNGKGHLPAKSVHEQALVEGNTAELHSPLLHYSYPNLSHYLEHFNIYTTILAKDLEKESVGLDLFSTVNYIVIKPKIWFIMTYIRHKGFADGFPGFAFSFFSSLRFPVAYIKYWEKNRAVNVKWKK